MLRRHQAQIDRIAQEIAKGEDVRHILADICPGGGKSLLPALLAKRLIGIVADRILWVVPRLSLKRQGAESFIDGGLRKIAGGHTMEIRESGNEVDPSRGTHGYITTYNAIHANRDLHRDEFRRFRYILVLDEPHHIDDEKSWKSSMQPLEESAVLTLFMTGTLERGNGGGIAFLPYDDRGIQDPLPARWRRVSYGLRDALEERAIIPLDFHMSDARAEYLDRDGSSVRVESLSEASDNSRELVFTIMNTELAFNILDSCADHWRRHRDTVNPGAKMLVVAHSIHRAKKYLDYLRENGVHAAIATSEDSQAAESRIERFKRKDGRAVDCLVTVQMAYEGLDVPSITHMACLTHIRSMPWVFQMFGRAIRFDREAGPWEEQRAYAFVPDDELMVKCIERIKAEQEPTLRQRREASERESRKAIQQRNIVPLSSEETRRRAAALHSDEHVDYQETSDLMNAMKKHNIYGSVLELKKLMAEVGMVSEEVDGGTESESTPMLTVKTREKNVRESIAKHVSRYERENGLDFGTINKSLIRHFNKSRTEMNFDELSRVWEYVQRVYPLTKVQT